MSDLARRCSFMRASSMSRAVISFAFCRTAAIEILRQPLFLWVLYLHYLESPTVRSLILAIVVNVYKLSERLDDIHVFSVKGKDGRAHSSVTANM